MSYETTNTYYCHARYAGKHLDLYIDASTPEDAQKIARLEAAERWNLDSVQAGYIAICL